MSKDTCIKANTYCPVHKGIVGADCWHDSKDFSVPRTDWKQVDEINTLREQVEKLTKELSVLKTTPPHLRQDLHCVASDLSAQVRERDEQLTAALAACEKKDEALDADNSKLWPSKLREEAISIQPDASALNEYRNQVIEECATCCEEHQGSAQTCANAIRGLKK